MTSLLRAASLALALFRALRLLVRRVRAESSQTPNHLVASQAKEKRRSPTLTGSVAEEWTRPLLRDSRIASVCRRSLWRCSVIFFGWLVGYVDCLSPVTKRGPIVNVQAPPKKQSLP